MANILFDRYAAALCGTLLHSLWLGVILAAVSGLIIMTTRDSRPSTRYNLLVAALVLFAAATCLTFFLEMKRPAVNESRAIAETVQAHVPAENDVTPSFQPEKASGLGRVTGFVDSHEREIALGWLLIIGMKLIQLSVGLGGVARFRRRQLSGVSLSWNERFTRLRRELGVTQAVRFFESGLAKVPMTIGTLKPVILLPAGLISNLPPDEVEAILVHELAHVLRRDYLVNLLQSLMEIALFFNPAVLWVSRLIRAERENCCDDLAIGRGQGKAGYIRALLKCGEFQADAAAFTMAFPGENTSLLDRVKRIARNRNHSLSALEKCAIVICVVVSGLLMSAFAGREAKALPVTVQTSGTIYKTDTTHFTTATPPTSPAVPGAVSNPASAPAQPPADDRTPVSSDTMRPTLPALTTQPLDKLEPLKSGQPVIASLTTKLEMPVTTQVTYSTDTTPRKEYLPGRETYHADIKADVYSSYKADTGGHYRKGYAPATPATPATWSKGSYKMADLLYEAGVIRDKENYTATLNNKELTVNGIRQPAELHERILKQFQKGPGDKVDITFSASHNSKGERSIK